MAQKWNLQDIRPAEPRKKRRASETHKATLHTREQVEERESEPQLTERENIPSIVIEDGSKKSFARLWVSVGIFIVIVGAAIGLSALMGKTELTIIPQHRERNVSAEFTAYPDKRDGALSYEILTLVETGEQQVKAAGQVMVEEQAVGTIEIIKTTPGQERLIKNTRFRTNDGLVYKIQESVVVPGAVKVDGVNMPGTIFAEVFASEAGEEYNLPADQTFDVPGFQEGGYTALYEAITARNPEPITGGFSGPQFEIDESELSTARQALQQELRDILLAQIENRKPAGFIAFDRSVAITYTQLPAVEYGDDLVTIKEQASLQLPLFMAAEFGSFLAQETIAGYDGTPVRVEDPSVLTFGYTSPTTSASVIGNLPSLTFSLTGKPLLIWEYDADELTGSLAAKPKTAIHQVIPNHPGIKNARVNITPFWKRSFPEDPNEIIIIEKLEEEE